MGEAGDAANLGPMRRLLTGGIVTAILIFAAAVGVTAYSALHAPVQLQNNNLTPENCSPGPCADLQGYTIWISNVSLNATEVSMTVKFRNSSGATHAAPEDLQLIDASRHVSGPVTDSPGCAAFTRHDFNNGATYGPLNLCFTVTNTTRPFTLHWAPNIGLFCCETDIKIT